MRFMVIRKADRQTEAGVMPSTELLVAMGAYMEEMVKAGTMLGGEGLHPSFRGARIKFRDGKMTVTDGPFAETRELIAGYAIIQAKDKAEALEWLKKWPKEDGGGQVELELRQIMENDDFGEEFTPELRAAEDKMREEMVKKK